MVCSREGWLLLHCCKLLVSQRLHEIIHEWPNLVACKNTALTSIDNRPLLFDRAALSRLATADRLT